MIQIRKSNFIGHIFVQFYETYSQLGHSKIVLIHLYPILSNIKGRFAEKRLHSLPITSTTFQVVFNLATRANMSDMF